MIATFDDAAWRADPDAVRDALEANRIVYFPTCPVPLPSTATLDFLRRELPSRLKLKNVSYHPEAGRVSGLDADAATTGRVTEVLRTHLADVSGFLRRVAGDLTEGARIGTCSFRPIEEKGRNLKPHASNELVHVDAGAYGATGGDRILRFFVNVNPDRDRVWATTGSFQDVLKRCGTRAGLLDPAGRLRVRIDKRGGDRAVSALVAGLARLYPLATVLDTSPYDRAMRRLHNYMKDDADFRADPAGYREIRFPPLSSWMVFTDGVSHASLEGQFALVTTMIVRRARMRRPEFSPFDALRARRSPALPVHAAQD
ncbi:MAG: Kdo hydroxylase family protein [Gammaproteobacteria bacterium]